MGLQASPQYITPLKSDGTVEESDGVETTWSTSRGVFTLAANTTYYFPLPIKCSTIFDVHLTHDNSIAITSARIETCGHSDKDVSNVSAIGGEWIAQNPSTAYVGVAGATTTATNATVAVVAGNAGGADWQVSGNAAPRARLAVVVGGTGGEVRVSFCGKE